jgi:hypothetical protein
MSHRPGNPVIFGRLSEISVASFARDGLGHFAIPYLGGFNC